MRRSVYPGFNIIKLSGWQAKATTQLYLIFNIERTFYEVLRSEAG